MDNWIATTLGDRLRRADDPLVIDLGFGASPVTTIELAARLVRVEPRVRVIGLEIDPSRVATAAPDADPPRLDFARGGFELAGHRPVLIRAANVLRQYDETSALDAWQIMRAHLAHGGALVDGTCDEIGRRGAWVLLTEDGPQTVTFACKTDDIERPSELAERLPKALIHHNVPGERIRTFLHDFDAAWDAAAALQTFGSRQRWSAACLGLATRGWPVSTARSRYGEITVSWVAVSP